jgi:DNA mismatch endonuclease (patch repair protein)
MDVLTPEQRRRCMSAIKGKNTKPEMAVRRMLHSLGYRYRLHVPSLPGKPDLVFSRRKKVIFVHGCFWHRHNCKLGKPVPKTNSDFWMDKLMENRKRDKKHYMNLKSMGWDVLVVWECNVRSGKLDSLLKKITNFLDG